VRRAVRCWKDKKDKLPFWLRISSALGFRSLLITGDMYTQGLAAPQVSILLLNSIPEFGFLTRLRLIASCRKIKKDPCVVTFRADMEDPEQILGCVPGVAMDERNHAQTDQEDHQAPED
jgi:hypothetical protein